MTPRHALGCSVAGKGLLINFQWRLLRLNATLVTCNLQSPVLQMDMVRSAVQQALTPPKHSDPVIASLPEGALPETSIVCGLAGSSLITLSVANLGPKLSGSKRMGTGREFPAPMVTG